MTRKIDAVNSRMVRRIVERCSPDKVILFSSHATGRAGPDSDVDLLVVTRTVGSKARRVLDLRTALRDFPVPKDIVVTSTSEFEWRKEIPGTIERLAAREGRILYEKP